MAWNCHGNSCSILLTSLLFCLYFIWLISGLEPVESPPRMVTNEEVLTSVPQRWNTFSLHDIYHYSLCDTIKGWRYSVFPGVNKSRWKQWPALFIFKLNPVSKFYLNWNEICQPVKTLIRHQLSSVAIKHFSILFSQCCAWWRMMMKCIMKKKRVRCGNPTFRGQLPPSLLTSHLIISFSLTADWSSQGMYFYVCFWNIALEKADRNCARFFKEVFELVFDYFEKRIKILDWRWK